MNSIKRVIAALLLLTLTLPLCICFASAKEITVTADGIDVFRDSGNLIIYTPAMGATTNTNEWGYEVIIEDNKAVKYSQGNSAIPANGFVLSGHDEDDGGKKMGSWIKENVDIGDYVYYTPNGIVTVSDTPVAASVFYDISQSIIGVNVTREVDSLVVFNQIGTFTATNEWGYEVVCEGGIVTKLGGNNNQVPHKKGSVVVSGHGTMVTWLQDNVKLGMSVTYDANAKTVTFAYDAKAAISGMDIRVASLEKSYNDAIARYDLFDSASANVAIDELKAAADKAKSDFEKSKDELKLVEDTAAVDAKATAVEHLITESRTVEYRGVWIRPTDTSASQVEETVQKLYDAGINMISIETLYDCTMIMPMPEGSLFETNPKFRKFDLLQAYIDACHERGMELHLWLPIFYVGDAKSANVKASLATKKPEWLSVSNTGKYTHQVAEPGVEGSTLMMMDPSNEEACNYLLNTYKYILETYDVDGIQLDYIRYYNRTSSYDFGYTKEALDAFEAEYGVRPVYDTTASYWKDWVDFRCNYISSFVQRMRKLIDDVAPGVLLGADVVPDPTESVTQNYQNYYVWLENKWLDILHPMAYAYGHEDSIIAQANRCGENAYLAVGLGIFTTEFGPSDMQAQASFNTSVYCDGSVYFEASSYLKEETGAYLKNGIYRNPAITPNYDIEKATKAQLEYAKKRITDIIIPFGGIDEAKGNEIVAAIDALIGSVSADGFDSEKYNAIVELINGDGGKEEAAERMLADMKLAIKAYTVANKDYDVSDVPELPADPDYSGTVDESSAVSEDDASNTSEPQADGEKNSTETIIIIVAIAVIVIALGACAFVLTKKKGDK
ncbi:MAG: family 10 glycosylhydrolase [Clostridia bacterium]|nr:family 10 glycosylhydrolase [Clostridia bacterium]